MDYLSNFFNIGFITPQPLLFQHISNAFLLYPLSFSTSIHQFIHSTISNPPVIASSNLRTYSVFLCRSSASSPISFPAG